MILQDLEAIPRATQEAENIIWVDSVEDKAGLTHSLAMANTKTTVAAQIVSQEADLDINLVEMGAGKAIIIHLILHISDPAKRAISPTDALPTYRLVSQKTDLLAFFECILAP